INNNTNHKDPPKKPSINSSISFTLCIIYLNREVNYFLIKTNVTIFFKEKIQISDSIFNKNDYPHLYPNSFL
ncbi:MAG: hypothetical protein U9R54_09890, partial [Bacteroidota bacterium]|nr:hypothetical protein [Bacteroidota bacterium]